MPDRPPRNTRKDMKKLLSIQCRSGTETLRKSRVCGHKIGFNSADLSVLFGYPANAGSGDFSRVIYPMLLQRRFAAATALLPIAGGFLLLLASTALSPAMAASEGCPTAAEVTVLPSPQAPWTGVPLRVMVVVDDKPAEGVLSLIAPDGSVAVKSAERHGGSPYFWFAEVAGPAAGNWHARLEREGASDCPPISRDIAVAARKPEPVRVPAGSIW